MATQPDDLDDDLYPDIVGEGIGYDAELDDDELPDWFIVESVDVETDDDAEADEGSTIVAVVDVAAEDPDDDFTDDPVLSVVAGGEDEEEDVAVRRSGEFVCSRCYLVKSNSQLANRKQKFCRDCA